MRAIEHDNVAQQLSKWIGTRQAKRGDASIDPLGRVNERPHHDKDHQTCISFLVEGGRYVLPSTVVHHKTLLTSNQDFKT